MNILQEIQKLLNTTSIDPYHLSQAVNGPKGVTEEDWAKLSGPAQRWVNEALMAQAKAKKAAKQAGKTDEEAVLAQLDAELPMLDGLEDAEEEKAEQTLAADIAKQEAEPVMDGPEPEAEPVAEAVAEPKAPRIRATIDEPKPQATARKRPARVRPAVAAKKPASKPVAPAMAVSKYRPAAKPGTKPTVGAPARSMVTDVATEIIGPLLAGLHAKRADLENAMRILSDQRGKLVQALAEMDGRLVHHTAAVEYIENALNKFPAHEKPPVKAAAKAPAKAAPVRLRAPDIDALVHVLKGNGGIALPKLVKAVSKLKPFNPTGKRSPAAIKRHVGVVLGDLRKQKRVTISRPGGGDSVWELTR